MTEDLTTEQEPTIDHKEREREAHDEYVRELLEDFDLQILMMERERL